MNFLWFSGSGGGAHELDLILFLFIGTVFLGAIEKEGEWFGNTEFLERKESSNGMCNEKEDLWHLFIMP